MKEVRNATRAPMRVHLGRGKVLHLGPGAIGHVADEALERDSVQSLVKDGSLEVVGAGGDSHEGDARPAPREATHGHPPTTVVMPKGNR